MVKLPLASVDAPLLVPFTITEAPASPDPSLASVTLPVTFMFCWLQAAELTSSRERHNNFLKQNFSDHRINCLRLV
jgi:hypothetical protein